MRQNSKQTERRVSFPTAVTEDFYTTLARESRASIKVQRSEFVGIAFPLQDESAFQQRLHAIEKEFFDATHHCWAYRVFQGGDIRARSSDAGEPSGTAGKPILTTLEGNAVCDAAIVVVRYYGGVKLGTGGLSRAYRDAAAAVLAPAEKTTRILYRRFAVTAPFSAMQAIYRVVSPPDVVLAGEEFGETNRFTFDVRRSIAERFVKELSEKRLEVEEILQE